MDVRRRFGLNVRRLREEKVWSQEEMADQSNVNRTYISCVERGIRNPTITVVEKLAKALQVPMGRLLDGSGSSPTA